MLSFRPMINDFFDTDRFLFDKLWNNETIPAVNIMENEKGFDIELAAPGLKKNDFKVKLENGMLTISAEKKEEKEEKTNKYTRQEFRYNAFTRSFTLPENAKEDDVQAHYEDGVLYKNKITNILHAVGLLGLARAFRTNFLCFPITYPNINENTSS